VARMLETEEAARRLGVKVPTLYAYVSRGLLVSHPAPAPSGRRRSLFDVDEVERLARRSRGGRSVETRMATITTGITQLTDDGPVYRGRRAVDLATTWSFEAVAELLWRGDDAVPDWTPVELDPPPTSGHRTGCGGRWCWPGPRIHCGPTSDPRWSGDGPRGWAPPWWPSSPFPPQGRLAPAAPPVPPRWPSAWPRRCARARARPGCGG
jgi:predicted DNA-binding transcriptional regulator AlpA